MLKGRNLISDERYHIRGERCMMILWMMVGQMIMMKMMTVDYSFLF